MIFILLKRSKNACTNGSFEWFTGIFLIWGEGRKKTIDRRTDAPRVEHTRTNKKYPQEPCSSSSTTIVAYFPISASSRAQCFALILYEIICCLHCAANPKVLIDSLKFHRFWWTKWALSVRPRFIRYHSWERWVIRSISDVSGRIKSGNALLPGMRVWSVKQVPGARRRHPFHLRNRHYAEGWASIFEPSPERRSKLYYNRLSIFRSI